MGYRGQVDTPEPTNQPAPDANREGVDDALLSRLQLIEAQPLEARAQAYVQVHEELRAQLEGHDAPRQNG